MKTKVILKGNSQYGDWKDGDWGHIETAVNGADGAPYLVIVLDSGNVVLVPTYGVKVIKE